MPQPPPPPGVLMPLQLYWGPPRRPDIGERFQVVATGVLPDGRVSIVVRTMTWRPASQDFLLGPMWHLIVMAVERLRPAD